MSVVATTSESCQINWTAVSSQDARGEVIGYEVSVLKNDLQYITSVLVCGGLTWTNISKLDAFSLYNIRAAVFNDAGKGNFSETLECITDEAGRFLFNLTKLIANSSTPVFLLLITNKKLYTA